MSRRKSPVTPTKVKFAIQLAMRQSRLSAAISEHAGAVAARQDVDQVFHAVLRAHRADNGEKHRGKDYRMGNRPQAYVTKDERQRTSGEGTKIGHACLISRILNAVGHPKAPHRNTTPGTRKRTG
jgi:hypothetical protein